MGNNCIGRFAPSPSGRMHLGNICTFMLAWLSAKSKDGIVLLRIEDLDTVRCTDEFAELIRSDLKWLGLTWDTEMPQQRYCGEQYEKAISVLRGKNLIYPCWCTRGVLNAARAPHASDGHAVYPGICRNLSPEERMSKTGSPSVRVIVPDTDISFTDAIYGDFTENLARSCGDYVLKKADGTYAYQLAVVVDDIAGGVTEVVRGRDLIGSCARQIWLTQQLGGNAPTYMHVPMLTGPEGRKLSKRDLDLDMGVLRNNIGPEKVLGVLANAVGLIERFEPISAVELLSVYVQSRIKSEDVELDIAPLL